MQVERYGFQFHQSAGIFRGRDFFLPEWKCYRPSGKAGTAFMPCCRGNLSPSIPAQSFALNARESTRGDWKWDLVAICSVWRGHPFGVAPRLMVLKLWPIPWFSVFRRCISCEWPVDKNSENVVLHHLFHWLPWKWFKMAAEPIS